VTPGKPLQDRVGVLLLNLGGPETLDDVKPFLYNLFADPDIIRLPSALRFLQPVLASIIATLRAPKSAEGYESIGGGSPLRKITDEQATALRSSLRAKGLDAEVYVAMRYWHPYTEEALQHVVRDGVNKLVILPLYPQFSISTSGSSLRLLEQLFREDPVLRKLRHTVIPSWYSRPGYVKAMVDLIVQELDRFGDPAKVGLVCMKGMAAAVKGSCGYGGWKSIIMVIAAPQQQSAKAGGVREAAMLVVAVASPLGAWRQLAAALATVETTVLCSSRA
jgi:ferrochelatase